MKSEVFSGHRFWSYFKYDFTQMWRNHVKASVGIGLSGLILYIIAVAFSLIFGGQWEGPSQGARIGVFMLAGTALELYQTRTYGYLTDRRKGSAWLMTPASTFEKWLSMILMTLIILPLLFVAVYLVTDILIAAFDPTVGNSIIYTSGELISDIMDNIRDVNTDYETTWNIWSFIPAAVAGFCFNYLFFLLCGICFRKNKIISAFVIIFLAYTLLSLIFSSTDLISSIMPDNMDNFAQAEEYFRKFFTTVGWITFAGAVGLGAGIFYRIKTLKH